MGKTKAFEVDEKAPTIVFDETIYGIRRRDPTKPRAVREEKSRPVEDADEYLFWW
jgi:hypothetical protein